MPVNSEAEEWGSCDSEDDTASTGQIGIHCLQRNRQKGADSRADSAYKCCWTCCSKCGPGISRSVILDWVDPTSSPALPQSLKYGWTESTFRTLTSSKFRNRCPKEAGLRVKNTDVWTDLGGFPSSRCDTDLQPDWEQSPVSFPWTTSWVDWALHPCYRHWRAHTSVCTRCTSTAFRGIKVVVFSLLKHQLTFRRSRFPNQLWCILAPLQLSSTKKEKGVPVLSSK